MTLKERISNDLKDAMRAREKQKLDTLRLVTAAIKQIEVDERIEVDDDRLLIILDKMVKQRKESIYQYEKAGRDDLVSQEQFELSIINQYMPEQLSDAEIEQMVNEAIKAHDAKAIADMGKVMASIKPKMQGRADMAVVSQLVRTRLS